MSKKAADLASQIFSEVGKESESRSDSRSRDDSSSSSDDKKDELKISKEFQESVIKYVKLDDLMRKKQQELSELREQKKPCEEYIIKYLEKINETAITITDGKLQKNKSENKASLNTELIKKSLSKKIADPKLLDEIMKELEDSRQVNGKVSLKRTGGNVKKAKVVKAKK